jgi:hypothetical protein
MRGWGVGLVAIGKAGRRLPDDIAANAPAPHPDPLPVNGERGQIAAGAMGGFLRRRGEIIEFRPA